MKRKLAVGGQGGDDGSGGCFTAERLRRVHETRSVGVESASSFGWDVDGCRG